MIVKIGNIFESSCSTIVNIVNCVGVMGKGIALEFKKKYPEMFMEYVLKCDRGQVKPGVPYIYQDNKTSILNFPTKDHWRSPSRLAYVVDGLDWFVENYEKYGIKSIAFPPLGCGNSNTRINSKWYLILLVVKALNERQYALKVGRTIYQKICYVLTKNGVDTGFIFVKGSYGPFSSQVKESINALANANLIVEKQLGRMISLSVSDDVQIHKENFTNDELNAAKKTIDLFGRVKCTDQAEMMATVLYSYDQLAKEKETISDKDVYEYVLEWKPRWKAEKEFELCEAIQNMAMLSLMKITCSGDLMDAMLV